MSANQVLLLVLALSAIGAFVLVPASIKWGLRWTGIANISLLKAFGIHVLNLLVSGLITLVAVGISVFIASKTTKLAIDVLELVVQLVTPCIIIAVIFKARLLRAAVAAIPSFTAGIFIVSLAFVSRAYFYEAFVIPTNAMAPTLLGDHWEASCPRCGQPVYGSLEMLGRSLMPDGMPGVCSNEMTTVFVTQKPQERGEGDRVFVCKLLQPQRWDLIVFRHTENGTTVNYVKRLVGLPGEKLEIRDGAIVINGKKLEPPAAIRGIHYTPTIKTNDQLVSGPGSVPIELGRDEYYVLGDFVDQSLDSRFWQQGESGHPPYAVPASNLVGVVINIYWPPSRWTSFRY